MTISKNYGTALKKRHSYMQLSVGPEHVIVRGIRPEEQLWGAYQFPRPYNLGDRLVTAVHVHPDNIKTFGEANRWFESRDRGGCLGRRPERLRDGYRPEREGDRGAAI